MIPLDMFVKGREKIALALCLLWVIVATASFYLIEFTGTFGQDLYRGQETFWMMIVCSLLLLILGLVIFFGQIRILPLFIFFSKEDLSRYNVRKISFLMGILVVALSYALTFVTIGRFAFLITIIICIAIIIGVFFTIASKRFETNT